MKATVEIANFADLTSVRVRFQGGFIGIGWTRAVMVTRVVTNCERPPFAFPP